MYTSVKPLLKEMMKEQGLTYKDLARQLQISESGVKKLFQADDCSIARLEQIAQVLQIDLATLILRAQDNSEFEQFEVDAKSQEFLQKNPLALNIYWLLLIEELNPSEILARYKISQAALYKCLSELDRRNLIEWKAKDRVQLSTRNKPFLVKADGPLMKIWMSRFADSIMDEVSEPPAGQKAPDFPAFAQRFLRLKPSSIKELRRRMVALVTEYTMLSMKERRLGPKKTEAVRVLAGLALGSMIREL